MAINKRERKKGVVYQAKLRDSNNEWISETFNTKKEAVAWETEQKRKMQNGETVTSFAQTVTIDQFWKTWFLNCCTTSEGWKGKQNQMYQTYIFPHIGNLKLIQITAANIASILQKMRKLGRGPQTQLHVYNLLHKMFEDAIEVYEYRARTPVKKSLRPKLIQKEAEYLEIEESKKLLSYVEDKKYGLAIWIQLLTGLRACEVVYLQWIHFDKRAKEFKIQGTYRRSEKRMIDYPKGKKDFPVPMPGALYQKLCNLQESVTSKYIVTEDDGETFMNYNTYYKALKEYIKATGVNPKIATHGLRHSTHEFYMESGATEEDMQILFAHQSLNTTRRYIHGRHKRRTGVKVAADKIKI